MAENATPPEGIAVMATPFDRTAEEEYRLQAAIYAGDPEPLIEMLSARASRSPEDFEALEELLRRFHPHVFHPAGGNA